MILMLLADGTASIFPLGDQEVAPPGRDSLPISTWTEAPDKSIMDVLFLPL
jgi:hypothetical protein